MTLIRTRTRAHKNRSSLAPYIFRCVLVALTIAMALIAGSFAPLHGERDEQREFGLAIPFKGWTFDVSNFQTGARNFFDQKNIAPFKRNEFGGAFN